jgi:two-component system response regulator HydG
MTIRKTPTVLVVEDDAESRAAMVKILDSAGYKTVQSENGQEGLDHIVAGGIDLLVTDMRLPVMDGLELLKRAKAVDQEIEVVLITGFGTVEVAVEAIKEGAYDFITKPIKKAQLVRAVEKAAEKQYLQRDNRELRSQLQQNGVRRLVYSSAEMREISRMVEQVAPSTATVLLTGESGTGKEVVADAIHAASPRRGKPMVKVSCAALPETLLEAELFGYEERRIHRRRRAQGRTLRTGCGRHIVSR